MMTITIAYIRLSRDNVTGGRVLLDVFGIIIIIHVQIFPVFLKKQFIMYSGNFLFFIQECFKILHNLDWFIMWLVFCKMNFIGKIIIVKLVFFYGYTLIKIQSTSTSIIVNSCRFSCWSIYLFIYLFNYL